MRKTKILAVILVMSLMITGVAYALWNQDTTLSTTAAMGNMDLAIACDPYIYSLSFMPGIVEVGRHWSAADMERYMDPLTGKVSSDKQSITVNVGNLYPGAKYGLNYTMKNTGTVPFKLQGVTISCTDNWALFSKLTGSFKFYYQKADGSRRQVTVSANALTTEGLGAAIVAACSDIIVYPGEQLVGCCDDQDDVKTVMQVLVDKTISGDDYENQHTAFTVNFNWQQCDPVVIG